MHIDTTNATIIKEFSRFAHSYDSHNSIQREVAKTLVSLLPNKRYNQIVDIGCGSGVVYKNILERNLVFKEFVALDSSDDMLVRHPASNQIKKQCINFDEEDAFSNLGYNPGRLLISSSALQWSRDIDRLYQRLSLVSKDIHFAIFTSNTFKTLHDVANIDSPIKNAGAIENSIQKYYTASFERKQYKLYFNSTKDMLDYIKRSGVSGGEKRLSFREIKRLIESYPLKYLEFEVLFVSSIAV